jgi:pimeloyl-ACP methyl ester carboxylesterase/ribosomal protein S18 acetylase RimI-like enzyme
MAAIAHLPEIDIAYTLEGDDDVTILLIHGLGGQLIDWDPAFVTRLVAAGYRVLRMDNRDAGASTHLEGKAPLGEIRRAVEAGGEPAVPYRLADMANDAAALLDHLGIESAHLVGVSMGGYIAQELAIRDPDRVLSLTSIMSSTGDRRVGRPSRDGLRALFRAPAADPAAAVDDMVDARRILATPGSFDADRERRRVIAAVARSYDPSATGRQLAAIWASGDRTSRLRRLDTPALVIHGDADHLVDVSGARATAAAIAGARLEIIEGMGHDLPPRFWGHILGAIVTHLDAACRPSAEVRIVPARPDDAPRIAEVCRRAFARDIVRYGSGPSGMDDPDTHRALFARGHCHALEVDARLVGGVYMFAERAGRWRLGSIFIDPDQQRRGLGSRLMEFAPRAHPDVRTIRLETPHRSDHLHRFYERHGYRRTGTTSAGGHPGATDPAMHPLIYERTFPEP